MKRFFALLFAGALFVFGGCTIYDPHSEMTPLAGSTQEPTVANRFPDSRGGFGLSEADEPQKLKH
jgi:hypothetical protein